MTARAWRSFVRNSRTSRTTLAWMRTTLTMATFGFGTVGFFRTLREKAPTPVSIQLHENALKFGVALIVPSVAATVMVAISHWFVLRRLRRNEAPVLGAWPLSITVALLVSVIGLASLWLVLGNALHGVAQ
jgi:putative membrane protein